MLAKWGSSTGRRRSRMRCPPRRARPPPRAGGRGDGRRRRAAAPGGAKRVMPPNPGIWKLSSGAPAPCPCRLRVGISVKLPLADEPGRSALRHPRIPIRTLAVAATEDGRRAPGRGAGVGKRMPPNLGCRKYRPAPRRHARAGCASAPRRSGRATTFLGAPPFRLAHIPLRRRRRGDGPRAAGAGTGGRQRAARSAGHALGLRRLAHRGFGLCRKRSLTAKPVMLQPQETSSLGSASGLVKMYS